MQDRRSHRRHRAAVLVLTFVMTAMVLAGCQTGEPFDYVETDEIPEGSGLFSGDDGEFVIYRQ